MLPERSKVPTDILTVIYEFTPLRNNEYAGSKTVLALVNRTMSDFHHSYLLTTKPDSKKLLKSLSKNAPVPADTLKYYTVSNIMSAFVRLTLQNHFSLATTLLDHNMVINIREYTHTVFKAVDSGDLVMLQKVINRGYSLYEDRIIVGIAARKGDKKMVEFLLDNGANIHGENDCALVTSVARGHTDVVKLLLDRGANVHVNGGFLFGLTVKPEVQDLLRRHM